MEKYKCLLFHKFAIAFVSDVKCIYEHNVVKEIYVDVIYVCCRCRLSKYKNITINDKEFKKIAEYVTFRDFGIVGKHI